MTLTKRIIPCLDVKNGRVVKGLNFESIKDAGDPVELAAKYSDEGADELVFLDITAVVVAIDAKRNYKIKKNVNIFSENDKKFWFEVFIFGGKQGTGIDVINWAKEAEKLGAGEILLTSIDADGTKNGYDVLLTKSIVSSASIPVIASGGCGKPEDMVEIFEKSNVDAALAASIFHYETHGVKGVKSFLKEKKISVRL